MKETESERGGRGGVLSCDVEGEVVLAVLEGGVEGVDDLE